MLSIQERLVKIRNNGERFNPPIENYKGKLRIPKGRKGYVLNANMKTPDGRNMYDVAIDGVENKIYFYCGRGLPEELTALLKIT